MIFLQPLGDWDGLGDDFWGELVKCRRMVCFADM